MTDEQKEAIIGVLNSRDKITKVHFDEKGDFHFNAYPDKDGNLYSPAMASRIVKSLTREEVFHVNTTEELVSSESGDQLTDTNDSNTSAGRKSRKK